MSQTTLAVSPARQRAALVVMCLAVVVVIANVTSLNVAVPSVGAALRADQAQLQWIVDAYALALAALLLPAGALGDRLSRKGTLLAGLALMTVAAAWSARAGTPLELILARGGAGLGAAFVFPSTLSTITAITAPDRRGRAIALWSACTTLGGIVGLIGAGALLQHHPWPWIFWATAIGSGACLLLAAAVAVHTKDPTHAHLDPLGTSLSVIAIGGLVLGITEGPVRGWSNPVSVTGLGAGALACVLFVVWELRCRRPLLDVRLFRDGPFGFGALSVLVLFVATFGAFFLCVQFVAYLRGYGPLDSGLAILPIGITLLPASMIGVALARRWSIYTVEALGMAVAAGAFVVLATLDAASSYWSFAGGLLVFGAGVGFCMAPATEAIVAALPAAKQGVASAVNDTARELGGALGIAIIGSVFNIGYRAAVDRSSRFDHELAAMVRRSPAAGLGAAPDAPSIAAVRDAFVHGWRLSLVVSAAVVAAGSLVVGTAAVRLRRPGAALAAAEPAAPPPAVDPPTTWDAVDAMPDLVRRAEASLAALRVMVARQQQTMRDLHTGVQRIDGARLAAAEAIEAAARTLDALAAELREPPQ